MDDLDVALAAARAGTAVIRARFGTDFRTEDLRPIDLERLPPEDARELAKELLKRARRGVGRP